MLDSLIVLGMAAVSLGTIQEADGVKEHTFWLRNSGSQEVVLSQGYTSCGCTTIHFDKDKAVAPGDSTAVTLRFNPRGKGGEFEEVGTIVYKTKTRPQPLPVREGIGHTQDGDAAKSLSTPLPHREGLGGGYSLRLSLVGNCITSEETLLRQFPIRINDTLRLSTNRFDLGIMHVGESKERNVVVLHRRVVGGDLQSPTQERIPIRFTVDAKTPKGLQHITHPIKVGRETVNITLDVLVK